jgi:uroporphyrinogen-III synthase
LDRTGVLITRPEPGASEMAARLLALDYNPVMAPLLRIRRLAARLPARVDAILVSSGSALPCLPDSLHNVPMLAVGNATAHRARAAGFTTVSSADGDALALADLTRRTYRPGAALLFATARKQGASLAATLRADGFVVHRRAVYESRPVARMPPAAIRALQDESLAVAIFLSAETARAFCRLLPAQLVPALAGIEALAIGQPAADALRFLPWRRVRVSAKSTQDSILAML